MKLFIRSVRNGQTLYTSYEGMVEATVRGLMTEIGHTDIESISEETYRLAVDALQQY